MAVTKFSNGFILNLAGDTASSTLGDITVTKIRIDKASIGTVTFKDGNGDTVLVTDSIGNLGVREYDFPGGWQVSALEMDAVSAGTAVTAVFVAPSNLPAKRASEA